MSWPDIERIIGELTLAAGNSAGGDLNELGNAIYSTYHAVSRTKIELTELLNYSGAKPSVIPGLMRRPVDQALEKLRIVLLDSPPNSLSSAGIFQRDKDMLFATLAGALDVARELYDSTHPARTLGDIDYWST
jgi:hypothetical protein